MAFGLRGLVNKNYALVRQYQVTDDQDLAENPEICCRGTFHGVQLENIMCNLSVLQN
jgi:hypothetical protein